MHTCGPSQLKQVVVPERHLSAHPFVPEAFFLGVPLERTLHCDVAKPTFTRDIHFLSFAIKMSLTLSQT